MTPMRAPEILPLFMLCTLTAGCPADDDDSTTPPDDDSASGDDDSAAGDDDATERPQWAAPDEAHAIFVGGGSSLGEVIEGGFDVDGDGVPEVAFGTPSGEPGGKDGGVDRGAVYLFFGLSLSAAGEYDVTQADVVIRGDFDGDQVGSALAGRGDVDGDGLDDIAIASAARPTTWIFFGSTLEAGGALLASQADVVIGEQVAECLRWTGDIDGDDLPELAISNTLNSTFGNVAGRTFVLPGSMLSQGGHDLTVADSWVDFPGGGPGEASGCETGGAGDIDGDGLADLLVGTQGAAPGGANSGMVSLFLGASLLATGGSIQLYERDVRFAGVAPDDRLGTDVHALGDIDGDLLGDFLLSARQNDASSPNAGSTYLVRAASLALGQDFDLAGTAAFLGEADGDLSGTSTAALGDVDGDGLPDAAIGAPRSDATAEDSGSIYVVLGSTAAIATAFPLGSADALIRGPDAGARFGQEVVPAGDIDGDGRADILAGAPRWGATGPGGPGPGKAYLLLSPYP